MKTTPRHAAVHADMAMRGDASTQDANLDAAMADWHKNFGF